MSHTQVQEFASKAMVEGVASDLQAALDRQSQINDLLVTTLRTHQDALEDIASKLDVLMDEEDEDEDASTEESFGFDIEAIGEMGEGRIIITDEDGTVLYNSDAGLDDPETVAGIEKSIRDYLAQNAEAIADANHFTQACLKEEEGEGSPSEQFFHDRANTTDAADAAAYNMSVDQFFAQFMSDAPEAEEEDETEDNATIPIYFDAIPANTSRTETPEVFDALVEGIAEAESRGYINTDQRDFLTACTRGEADRSIMSDFDRIATLGLTGHPETVEAVMNLRYEEGSIQFPPNADNADIRIMEAVGAVLFKIQLLHVARGETFSLFAR